MHLPPSRRRVLKLTAGGAIALTTVTVGSRLAGLADGDPSGGLPALQLSSHGEGDVDSLEVRLGDRLLPRSSSGRWQSSRLPTSTHSMVAFTWSAAAATPRIAIRSRVAGDWGDWQRVPALHDVPDEDSGESTSTVGTDLMWIGKADGIQIDVAGARPDDLTLVLLHPSRMAADAVQVPPEQLARATTMEASKVPRPEILTREDWHANEKLRNGGPYYNKTIQQAHVHHTANSNNYTKDDVAGLIRGIYAYHTQSLGWSDIAYNFLVDRFGRIWEGRAGGINRPVRGAHTLGFNATSTGISVIGNFDLATPSPQVLAAVAATAAWKLDLYDRHPLGRAHVTSEGSDKYPVNRVVSLPVIDGHRDTNDTECPGQHLYDALPGVRRRAAALMEKYHSPPPVITVTTPPSVSGRARLGGTLVVHPGEYTPTDATVRYRWLRDGHDIPAALAASYVCTAEDVGHTISVRMGLALKGAEPVSHTVTTSHAVTAPSQISLRISSRRKRAKVHVRLLRADGVTAFPTGQVVVTVGGRVRTLTLVDGVAIARYGRGNPVPSGDHPVTVDYAGDGVYTASSATDVVSVP